MEFNTIASSFGCLSTLVARMHAALLGRAGAAPADLDRLPSNEAMDEIADAIALAAADHGAEGGVVLMVVQAGERNAFDQQVRRGCGWAGQGRVGGQSAQELLRHQRSRQP